MKPSLRGDYSPWGFVGKVGKETVVSAKEIIRRDQYLSVGETQRCWHRRVVFCLPGTGSMCGGTGRDIQDPAKVTRRDWSSRRAGVVVTRVSKV